MTNTTLNVSGTQAVILSDFERNSDLSVQPCTAFGLPSKMETKLWGYDLFFYANLHIITICICLLQMCILRWPRHRLVSTSVNPELAPWPLPAKTAKKILAPANIAKKTKKPVNETRWKNMHIPAKPKEAALAHDGAILAGTPPHQHSCPYYPDGSILSIENIKYYVGKSQFLAGKGCTVCTKDTFTPKEDKMAYYCNHCEDKFELLEAIKPDNYTISFDPDVTFFLVEIVGSGGPILFLNTDRVGSLYIN